MKTISERAKEAAAATVLGRRKDREESYTAGFRGALVGMRRLVMLERDKAAERLHYADKTDDRYVELLGQVEAFDIVLRLIHEGGEG
jgi:hypothetical protein